MAWLVCGTIPAADFPLLRQTYSCDAQEGVLRGLDDGRIVPVQRGTSTLYAAAVLACGALQVQAPCALLVGDVGDGDGSKRLYLELARDLSVSCGEWEGITFHYLYPDLDGHNRVLASLEGRAPRPLLVADAGFMYAAKMSGFAGEYDLFTPDVGELSFLADDRAPHPLYTRGFLLASEKDVPRLVAEAYAHGNAAKNLLVKGRSDTVVLGGEIRCHVSEPQVAALEAIGGTGDVVAGLVSAFLQAGFSMEKACVAAARAARLAGARACPTPATQVAGILPFMGRAVLEAAHEATGAA